jgi:phosphoribosylformylglycinamidine synthase subunit PurL
VVAAPEYAVAAALKKENLSQADYDEICRRLGRAPNRAELGMFGVMWSEHCCYRNSRPLLSGFPTSGPRILVGPGENAGVVDLGEGQRLAFKIESHNHPSAVEPFQGAATGVGGILRDIFTMGARPIALLNALRFGPLEDERNVGLMEGVVAGIAHYGNCVGVPTVGGEVAFDASYSGNPLVNAMALGLMETEEIVCSGAEGVGYPVVYVGSTTGRDGMGGASFASAELTEASLDDRPAVQVGDPFLEKGLIEACLEAFQSGDVVAAQDMGAAGLTCSCSEMAAKGGLGIELDLDRVPAREAGMTAYEFLLSESQERMLFVVKPGREEALMERFSRWGLQAAVVGRVLEDNIVRVLQHGQVAAEVPASALADDTPINHHELISEPPAEIQAHWRWSEAQLPAELPFSWNEALLALLDDPTIASKRWVYRQYDHQVQANTVVPPGGADAAVVRLRPQQGEGPCRQPAAVWRRWSTAPTAGWPSTPSAAAWRRWPRPPATSAAWAPSPWRSPTTSTSPRRKPPPATGSWRWPAAASRPPAPPSTRPVTGGNVSLYNETRLPDGRMQPIHPTPVVGMVGLVHNLEHVRGQAWRTAGDAIWLLGVPLETGEAPADPRLGLAGSSYLERLHGAVTGRPPEIDLQLERAVQGFLRQAIAAGLVASAHDLSDGGLAVAAAECCIATATALTNAEPLGAELELPASSTRTDRLLFAEGGARILVSVPAQQAAAWQQALDQAQTEAPGSVPAQRLGQVSSQANLRIQQAGQALLELPVAQLADCFEQAIPRRMGCGS